MIEVNPNLRLRISIRTLTAVSITSYAIYEMPDGSLQHQEFTVSVATALADGTLRGYPFPAECPLGGKLITVTSSMLTSNIQRGQCYVRLELYHSSISSVPFRKLLSRYITSNTPVNYPDDESENSQTGMGYLAEFTIANPSAGSDFQSALSNVVQRIISADFLFTTSSTPGNRRVGLSTPDYNFHAVSTYDQPESTAVRYLFTQREVSTDMLIGANQYVYTPLPKDFFAQSNGSQDLFSVTVGMDGADQYSAIHYFAEQWILD